MTYFNSIRNNIEIIQCRLDELMNYLENEYKNTPKKFNLKIIRENSNGIFNNMEDLIYFKNKLNKLTEQIIHIEEYELGQFNVEQMKYTTKIILKVSTIFINTKDEAKQIKFINQIIKKLKVGIDEIDEDNSILELSIEEIQQLKMGALARYIIKKIASDNKFSEIDIDNMQSIDWCKNVLKLNNHLIKRFIKDDEELDQHKINNVIKYYKTPFTINGNQYFLSNELFERSREIFIEWYKVKSDELFDTNNELLFNYEKNIIDNQNNNLDVSINNKNNSNSNVEDDADEIKDEYLTDPFKILNWLDKHTPKESN